jgi:hypothetical protein
MNELRIQLEHCYGIKSLSYVFNFSDGKPYTIYAPNGFMKTSMSKTFLDLSNNKVSTDLLFPDRKSLRVVKDEKGLDLKSESVFVVEPYREDFESERASLLLVNQELKKKYDAALKGIEDKKDQLIKKLKQLSGLTGKSVTPETEILKTFGAKSLLDLVESIAPMVATGQDSRLSLISYVALFNEKAVAFLDSGQIKAQLAEYIEKYEELIGKSDILNKSFNHYHAKTVQKNLAENGFFAAKHSVNLFNGKSKDEVMSADDLDARIEEEKKKVLSDSELQKRFDAIDKKLTNVELRAFRDYLFENKDLVPELANYGKLRREVWLAYFVNQGELFLALASEFKNGKSVIEEAVKAAREQKTEWEEVVALFNKRFSVPFELKIENQEDVILKEQSPRIAFLFRDPQADVKIERALLLDVLSQGERRALYLLNILFELNVRRKQGLPTLVLIDDVADSFDYKNKYAIVEYLAEIARLKQFVLIFLTHNFDFHRTVRGRLGIPREKCLVAQKAAGDITFAIQKYQKNPFIDAWKDNLHNPKYLVSAIPFVRNLAEYCGCSAEEEQLTSLLHIKSDTKNILIRDLQAIFISILKDQAGLVLADPSRPVVDVIHETAKAIHGDSVETPELEEKIVLSIAIRLMAEDYMIQRLSDEALLESIKSHQTQRLVGHFKGKFSSEVEAIQTLEQVNLMTPENIHVNSFMYEPILDMAADHLKSLYTAVTLLK